MALTEFTKDVNYISSLSNRPNEIDGLTSNELKEKFDQAGKEIKEYINDTLTKEIDAVLPNTSEYVRIDDSRLSDSRKCDNTFDNWSTARTNLKIGYGTSLPSSADNGSIYLLYK